jgi:alpha-mannosidase
MPKTTVHMIGQAHLDPVWLWRWTEGRAEALATSQSAVDRLDEYPDFHFTRGEERVYSWIEDENPELFARIVSLVKQGRWHPVNGMVVQPDMNLPQGESFVRHFLIGKRFMRERLGFEPTVAYCVDSFGHAATLPQIFRQCGCDYYVFMRPGPHEKRLPAQAFWWQAPDGSRVLAFRITASYAIRDPALLAGHIDGAVQAKPEELDRTMCFFGVGNHGGGPTRCQIEEIQALARQSDDLDIRFSFPDEYFEAILSQVDGLPVVEDELQYHAVGCYSANSALKRTHRQAECSLLTAERMAVLAELWAGRPVPKALLRRRWHDVCFNQFHDILGGCSIKEAEDEAIMALGRATLAGSEIADASGRAVANRIDTCGPGGAVVLFNPFPEPCAQYVEYEPWTGWLSWVQGGWGLTDSVGQPVSYQRIETHEALSHSGGGLTRIVFRAELPPLGYALYRFAPGEPPAPAPVGTRASATSLENGVLLVRLDPDSGAITSCLDKRSGIELVGPGGWNVAQVLEDTSDTWSHGIRRFEEAGSGIVGHFGAATIGVCDDGPLQASLLVERSCGSSTWMQQLILRHGEAALLIRNWLCWQGRHRVVKLAFDVATDHPRAVHDVPYGGLDRACDGAEVPTQMWVDVSGPARGSNGQVIGLALIDDGKYGCDVRDSTLRLTVLRCPPYAHHIPHVAGTKKRYDWIDQGSQEFTLIALPHVGDWRDSGVVRLARAANLPPPAVTIHAHGGDLPQVQSMASLTSAEMEMTALKAAEDGDGYIVRIVDRHGRGGTGELGWYGESFPLSIAPFEVITLRLARTDGQWRATRCDMLERPAPG